MTVKLYLEDLEFGYHRRFDATVLSVEDEHVVLDRTLFYPLGGGQHWDTGVLQGPNGELQVSEVRGRNDVAHTVGADHQLQPGDEVRGIIDWDTRYAHMRMHTAQHLISGLAYELFDGVRTVGNQIHADRSRIDFNPISFDDGKIATLLESTNDHIDQALEVTDAIMTRDAINAIMPADRTNMDLLPASVSELRIIQIGDRVDMCPCAGTHVTNIGELGHVEFLGKKSKGKGTQRFSYQLSQATSPRSVIQTVL